MSPPPVQIRVRGVPQMLIIAKKAHYLWICVVDFNVDWCVCFIWFRHRCDMFIVNLSKFFKSYVNVGSSMIKFWVTYYMIMTKLDSFISSWNLASMLDAWLLNDQVSLGVHLSLIAYISCTRHLHFDMPIWCFLVDQKRDIHVKW